MSSSADGIEAPGHGTVIMVDNPGHAGRIWEGRYFKIKFSLEFQL